MQKFCSYIKSVENDFFSIMYNCFLVYMQPKKVASTVQQIMTYKKTVLLSTQSLIHHRCLL